MSAELPGPPPTPFPLPLPLLLPLALSSPLPFLTTTQRTQWAILSTVRSTPAAQLPDDGRTLVRTAPDFQYAISFGWVGSLTSKTRNCAFWKLQASILVSSG